MKKIMSTMVATLAAFAFTSIAFAAPPQEAPAQPAIRAEVTPPKPEVKKHHHKRHHRKHHRKCPKGPMKRHEGRAPQAPAAPTPPPAPPAPPAK